MIPDTVDVIEGGYWVPKSVINIPIWQRQTKRLDHDFFLTPYCTKLIPPGGCVVDGGAFDGDHTIAYSRKAGRDGLIFAFEPGKLAFTCLEHNTSIFPDENVIVAPFALGSCEGTATHYDNQNPDLGSAFCEQDDYGTIRIVTLDSIIKPGFPTHRKVDFIKLDLEGWELDALRGAERILKDDKPTLVLEINVAELKKHGATFGDINSFISQFGYSHRQVDGQQHDPLLWDEVYWASPHGEHPPVF